MYDTVIRNTQKNSYFIDLIYFMRNTQISIYVYIYIYIYRERERERGLLAIIKKIFFFVYLYDTVIRNTQKNSYFIDLIHFMRNTQISIYVYIYIYMKRLFSNILKNTLVFMDTTYTCYQYSDI